MRAGAILKHQRSGSHPHTLFWECPSMRWKRGEGRTSSVDKGTLLPAKDVRESVIPRYRIHTVFWPKNSMVHEGRDNWLTQNEALPPRETCRRAAHGRRRTGPSLERHNVVRLFPARLCVGACDPPKALPTPLPTMTTPPPSAFLSELVKDTLQT